MTDTAEQRGERDYWNGANLNDNPYQESHSKQEWERGNWYAYDEHKRQQSERER